MRALLSILLFALCLKSAISQVTVNDRVEKTTIARVLERWSANYNVVFAYDSYEMSNYLYSGVFEAVPLEAALELLLSETPFSFRLLNGTYVILPAARITSSSGLNRQTTNQLTGAVFDRLNGESLPFASVAAVTAGVSATADSDGSFNLIYQGSVDADTLVVIYLGYATYRHPFKWSELMSRLKIELVPGSSFLPSVDVRGTISRPVVIEIEPATLTLDPNLTALRYGVGESDIFRSAQFSPGISAVLENSNGLFIRGSSSDQSQLLFDGFTVYHQDHFFGMFSSLNALAVKAMRINKCPTDPAIGGRAAGIIEVIGKEGDLRRPAGVLDFGTMSISGSFETPLDTTGKASLFLSGRRSITEWLKGPAYRELFRTLYSASIVTANNDLLENTGESFDPELLFQDLNAKFTYRSSWRNHFNVSFYASRDKLNFNYADTSTAELVNVSDIRYLDEATKANRGVSARWVHRISPRLEVQSTLGFSAFQGVYFSTDSIRNNLFAIDSTRFTYRDVLLSDWNALHRWQYVSANHKISWGGAYNRISTIEKTRAQNEDRLSDERTGHVFTLFVGDEWKLARWVFQPAMRLNLFNTATTKVYPEPKITARYRAFRKVLFMKVAAARSVQFVQRVSNQSLYQNVPDQWQISGSGYPVIEADQLMVGANWSPRAWNIDVEAFIKRTHGQLLNIGAGQYTNLDYSGVFSGIAYARGIDAAVQWERPPHRVLSSFSRVWAASDYNGLDEMQIQETYIRSYEGKFLYEWRKGAWNASVVGVTAQGAPYTALLGVYNFQLPDGSVNSFPLFGGYNRSNTNAYYRFDVAMGYRWQWMRARWQLTISVYNVLDTPNYRAIQYSLSKSESGESVISQRQIRMIGRVPSINLTCQF
jgi:hypothetical protein